MLCYNTGSLNPKFCGTPLTHPAGMHCKSGNITHLEIKMLKHCPYLNNQIGWFQGLEYYPSMGNMEEDNGDENLTTT